MAKKDATRNPSPYDLNANLKVRKTSAPSDSNTPRSPYALTYDSSLKVALKHKR